MYIKIQSKFIMAKKSTWQIPKSRLSFQLLFYYKIKNMYVCVYIFFSFFFYYRKVRNVTFFPNQCGLILTYLWYSIKFFPISETLRHSVPLSDTIWHNTYFWYSPTDEKMIDKFCSPVILYYKGWWAPSCVNMSM